MKKKKGFTLVELLVVIAILAILATVTVVGYIAFTDKAKLSNDQSTIKMLNDNLLAASTDGRPETASEAIEKLASAGINSTKLEAYSKDYHYAYSLENNMFCLLDDNDNIVYPENSDLNKDELWGLFNNSNSDGVGLSKYVALKAVNSIDAVNAILTQDITIDLNGLYYNVLDKEDYEYKITLLNGGTSINNENVIASDNSVKVYEVSMPKDINEQLKNSNEIIFEDMIFDRGLLDKNDPSGNNKYENIGMAGKKITYKDCLFVASSDGDINKTNFTFYGSDVTFENCKFNSTIWSIQASVSNKLMVKNCEFTNAVSGINIQSTPTEGAFIEGNTFNLLANDSSGKSSVIMLSTTSNSGTYKINVSNNVINSCGTVIRLHSAIYPNINTIDASQIIFSGNKYGTITGNKCEKWVSGDLEDMTNVNSIIEELIKVIK